jgi:WhiB family redox-sensing transcriptional regulator
MTISDAFMEFAKCKNNKEIDFFPTTTSDSKIAQKFCKDCPVKMSCLEYALQENILHGVWGGLPTNARLRIRRNKLKSPQAIM